MVIIIFLLEIVFGFILSLIYALLGYWIADVFNVPYLQDFTYWQLLGFSLILGLFTTKVDLNSKS